MENTSSCSSNPTSRRVAVVTGGNKGIGLEISRQLESSGVFVVLTARDESRGRRAVEKLKESGASSLVFHQVDVADPASVTKLADFILNQFGKLDILVNNAAIGGVEFNPESLKSSEKQCVEQGGFPAFVLVLDHGIESYDDAKECLNINYYGTKRVTEALIPLLQLSHSPRIVNVSSGYGKLQIIPSENIREEFRAAAGLKEDKLDELIQLFLDDFKAKELENKGWPTRVSAYKVAKVAVGAYTRILAKRYPTFCINCVDPGFVKTDINWNTGKLTTEQGAKGPVMLALLPDGSPTGLFYSQTEVSTFE